MPFWKREHDESAPADAPDAQDGGPEAAEGSSAPAPATATESSAATTPDAPATERPAAATPETAAAPAAPAPPDAAEPPSPGPSTPQPPAPEPVTVPGALIAGAAIRKLPVVSIVAGEDIAEIRDIIYDADAGAVVGFTLNKRGMLSGRLKDVLATDRVHAIGQDAVMVADESQLIEPGDAPESLGSPDKARNVIGNDVLTEAGTSLGTIVDVIVLAAPTTIGRAGLVVGYEVKQTDGIERYVPLPAQLSVSGSALVVPDATEEFIVGDIGALGAAIERFQTELRTQPREPRSRPDAAGAAAPAESSENADG